MPHPHSQTAALFDIDGTLTSHNVWKGLMDFFSARGERRLTHWLFVAAHYPMLLPRALRLLNEADFRRAWTKHLPWYFKGYDEAQMKTLAEWVARDHTVTVARGDVLEILRRHLSQGDVVALVSGAPVPLVQAIAQMWNVPHAIGSPVEFRDGRYTGRMSEPCIDEQKAVYVRRYFADNGFDIDFKNSYAYADSYSDLGMFEMVGNPVAVYPDKKLAALAEERGWRVVS